MQLLQTLVHRQLYSETIRYEELIKDGMYRLRRVRLATSPRKHRRDEVSGHKISLRVRNPRLPCDFYVNEEFNAAIHASHRAPTARR
jgi:hypothetical protein